MLHQLKGADGDAGQGGFTLIELLVTITIFGVMLAIAIPNLTSWLLTAKARSVSEFYMDGLAMARRQAVSHNASSRISFTANANTGQMDWEVDLCFPVPGTLCTAQSGVWSTPGTPAANDPQGGAGYTSVVRVADSLPTNDVLIATLQPDGASEIYFNSLGWVDTTVPNHVTQLRFDPTPSYANDVPPAAVSITLGGMATKCNPTVPATDSRACPP
jgi:type IV fimbrial biogenesis protein FimT